MQRDLPCIYLSLQLQSGSLFQQCENTVESLRKVRECEFYGGISQTGKIRIVDFVAICGIASQTHCSYTVLLIRPSTWTWE